MDGRPDPDARDIGDTGFVKTYYSETSNGKCVPRAIFVNLDPSPIDEICTRSYRQLYHPELLVRGKEDAANKYARVHHKIGAQMVDGVTDRIRRVADSCSLLQGCFIFYSFGGGTGSGLGTLLLERLSTDYGKKSKLGFSVYSASQAFTAMVEPYNPVLSTLATSRTRIAKLVPYPCIYYPLVNFAPVISANKRSHESFKMQDLTLQCFEPQSGMVLCDLRKGKDMAVALVYHGGVVPRDCKQAVVLPKVKSSFNLVEWCPAGFKFGINSQKPVHVPGEELAQVDRPVNMLSNTTAIAEAWSRLDHKFNLIVLEACFRALVCVREYRGRAISVKLVKI